MEAAFWGISCFNDGRWLIFSDFYYIMAVLIYTTVTVVYHYIFIYVYVLYVHTKKYVLLVAPKIIGII